MGHLDSLVTATLVEKVLEPGHIAALVSELRADIAKTWGHETSDRAALESRFREADLHLSRLFDALENGTVTDSDTFKDRLSKAQAERQETLRLLTEAQRREQDAQAILTPRKVAAFSKGMADLLRTGDIQFRKAFLRTFVDKVAVLEGEVRIRGSKDALAHALEAGVPAYPAKVRSLVQEWRARRDSNP